jgi:hypothetical protein
MTFPTLEQLAEKVSVNFSEYGLKTEGLIRLIKAIPILRSNELYNDIEYEVEPGFVVPKSSDLSDLTELKESYFELVKDEDDYCVILARSSHEDEEPGKFDTIPVLYDASKPEGSFERFAQAVNDVRADPEKAVIAQKMFGKVEEVKIRMENGYEETRKVIGATNTGLTCLSHSRDYPKDGVINACLGLTSKLVQNPDEISIVYFRLDEYEYEDQRFISGQISPPKNTGNTYTDDSQRYVQEEVEVFDIETQQVIPVNLINKRMTEFYDGSSMPAGLAWNSLKLAKLAYYFSKELEGCKVEFEAASDWRPSSRGGKLSIFQLTELPILDNVIDEITVVPEERVVVCEDEFNIGSIQFSGDVILYEPSSNKGDIKRKIDSYNSQEREFLLATDRFRDDLLENTTQKNYIIMGTGLDVAINLGYHGDQMSNRSLHIFGAIETQLHKRTVIGDDKACFIPENLREIIHSLTEKDFGTYAERVEIDEDNQIAVLKDVTVEVVGGKYQMFFN